MELEAIIGLEIHLQLKTQSKMYCACPVVKDVDPNTAVCPVCLGHPGTLPVVNREAVRQGMRIALALDASIAAESRFDRKNYFYPDLPKGYQITQYDHPMALGGILGVRVVGTDRTFRIHRIHLEEDTGKLFHRGDASLVDFNRAGVPLAEIVTEPDLRSAEEARLFLQELRLIARYCAVSDADMEKGQMRCDANVSLRPIGDMNLYPKTEVKNMNSFRSVERALAYEIERQRVLWEAGTRPNGSETRGWNDDRSETVLQRTKEGSDDYRFFPEPDLPPLVVTEAEVTDISSAMPELPEARRERFVSQYAVQYEEAAALVADKDTAEFFEQVVSELKRWIEDVERHEKDENEEQVWQRNRYKVTKFAYSWITTELYKHLNTEGKTIKDVPISAEDMAEFITLVYEAKVNSSAAQTILEVMYHEGGEPHHIAEDMNLLQQSDSSTIRDLAVQVIITFPEQVRTYRNGKEGVLQFLIGQVMKLSGGRADPAVITSVLKDEISKLQ